MARRRRIYEGKAKVIYEGTEPGTLVQYFKDDIGLDDASEGAAGAAGIDADLAGHGATGAVEASRQVFEGHLEVGVGFVLESAIHQLDIVGLYFPDRGGPLDHFCLDVLGAIMGGPTGGEGRAAAPGQESVTD